MTPEEIEAEREKLYAEALENIRAQRDRVNKLKDATIGSLASTNLVKRLIYGDIGRPGDHSRDAGQPIAGNKG